MGQIVNLRQARKRKARDVATREAEANRVRHGRTKAERQRDDAQRKAETAFLDGHRRPDGDT
jgi:hypothetical protein